MRARHELGELLRARRDRISPRDVGLSDDRPRRVPGLRREEVARLAGVSVGHYTRLEQGRDVGVSADVLDAVADALRMPDDERRRLFELVGPSRRSRRRPVPHPQRVRPGVEALVHLVPAPALVIGRRLDVLASNQLARVLLCDFDALPLAHRNQARWLFLDPVSRARYLDWDLVARESASDLRARADRHPDDAVLADLVAELGDESPEFARWWAGTGPPPRRLVTVRLRHPAIGELTLSHEVLTVSDVDDQVVQIDVPAPGSASERALQVLAGEAARPSGGSAPQGFATGFGAPHRRDVGGDVAVPDRLVPDDRDER